MSDEADQKVTQLKDMQVIEERVSQELLGKHRWKTDWARVISPTTGKASRSGSASCTGAERKAKRIWFVAECLFKSMNKLWRKETRRRERDHKDLFLLDALLN